MCSEIRNKSFKAVFPIPAISLNCVKMLPAVIRAELNYIRAGFCVATPSVCLYRAHTRFFLLFAARRSCCLFLFLLTSPSLKGRCAESIAFAQFISGQVNRAEWNGGTCTAHGRLNSCDALLINNTADRHQVEWKGTDKHYCWIIDNSVLHYPERHWGNSKQTIMPAVTAATVLHVNPAAATLSFQPTHQGELHTVRGKKTKLLTLRI